ncbi:unnamed protein product [Spirodela intermedia]|uniref:Uncharacterized protein n=1 Tax=Spirodela intermedia TaxID=51605 RepID=A0A7I8IDR3_SPIIN|nr:unnamed protein product [Spirodela intermedia]CAA6655957.1 unnamed protein product [Spirodela intermedia]
MDYNTGRSGGPSALENLGVQPVPYPVLLLLGLVGLLLGVPLFLAYESAVEEAQQRLNWGLMAVPVLLIFAIRWAASFQGWAVDGASEEGGSPWAVAAVVVLVLVLVSFQSTFRDVWST